MDVFQVFFELVHQILLLSWGLGRVHEGADDLVDMQLLAPWKPFGLPMTLYHRYEPPELGRETHAFDLLRQIERVIVVVYSCDATLLLLDPYVAPA